MPNRKPQIIVVGAGGVGGYYGAKLMQAGFDTIFLVRPETCDVLRNQGLSIKSVDGDMRFSTVSATSDLSSSTIADVVVLTAKATETDNILPAIAAVVGPETAIVSLQNGIDNEEKVVARFPQARIVGGVAFVGSRQLQRGVIEHRAEGRATVGPWRESDTAAAKRVHQLFCDAKIPAKYSDNIRRDLWTKLMWNAAFNTTSCLAGAHVISVLRAPGGTDLARQAMREVQAVARVEGVDVPNTAIDNYINDTLRLEWGTTSMLTDREANRPVEADAIAGVVVKRGQAHGIAVPVMATLYSLLSAYNASRRLPTAN